MAGLIFEYVSFENNQNAEPITIFGNLNKLPS
jgi:hypothetical protein